MRERRHLSGNSNIPTPRSSRSETDEKPTSIRRIHSARCERNISKSTTSGLQPTRPAHSARRHNTPRLSHSNENEATPPQATPPQVTPISPILNPVVTSPIQWAVKISGNQSESTPTQASNSAPDCQALNDFGALLRDRYDGKRSLRLAFLNWDQDKDGQLSGQEVREMIASLGFTKRLGSDNVEAIIHHVHTQPTQCLQYDDFCGYIFRGGNTSTSTATVTSEIKQTEPVVLSSDRALYPDIPHVVNLLRKRYESRPLRNIFRHWDGDKDGGINIKELDINLRRQGVRLTPTQLKEMIETHAIDGDGILKYNDFVRMINGNVLSEYHNPALQAHVREMEKVENQPDPYLILRNAALGNPQRPIDEMEESICAAVQYKLKLFAPQIHDAYAAFDHDHSGNLSYLEFRQGLNALGLHFSEREFMHLASIVDTDGSGEVSFHEFQTMFNRRPAHQIDSNDIPSEKHVPHAILNRHNSTGRESEYILANGTFDFTHLTRRVKIPTRRGRTPKHDTKELINVCLDHDQTRFHTSSQIYGSGQSNARKNASDSQVRTTIGQEEKQQRNITYHQRLERIREQIQAFAEKTQPLIDNYDKMQQRRVETLHRHQQRYQQSIEEQRPHFASNNMSIH